MSTTFSCRGCDRTPATPPTTSCRTDLNDALACRFDGLTPEEIQRLVDADEITCTCGLTFGDQAGFDGHQDQAIQELGTVSGHWEVGTI